MRHKQSLPIIAAAVVLVVAAWALRGHLAGPPAGSTGLASGEAAVLAAFRERRSDLMVQVSGEVKAVLPDDLEGSRHQRFILRLDSGHTLLIAHNIDLAPRVPLAVHDAVAVKGEYEWNREGGVVHWTHHDPAGRHPGGFVEHEGLRYE